MNEIASLPEFLAPFFWEYEYKSLSWPIDRELIIRRILVHGSWEAVLWLWKKIGDEGLREWIYNHHGADLSPRHLRFWEVQLDLDHQQVNGWIEKKKRSIWGERLNNR